MRLCEPFPELNSCRIVESLGLDATGYRNKTHAYNDGKTGDLNLAAFADFDLCEGFTFECPECKKLVIVRSTLLGQNLNLYFALESCPECRADLLPHAAKLKSALHVQLNGQLSKFAASPYICEDKVCGSREVDLAKLVWKSSQGPTCLKCESTMQKEFPLRELFQQQKFFATIFDWKKHFTSNCSEEQRRILKGKVSHPHIVRFYEDMAAVVASHIDNNRFSRVRLADVFRGFKLNH